MNVLISKKAYKNISKIIDFICEEYKAEETALKFSKDLQNAILALQHNYNLYTICKNKTLADLGMQCFIFKKKWTIAYKVTKSKIIVHEIINGKALH